MERNAPPVMRRIPRHIEDRCVRIFISSTFRDMFAEREELVRRTFTQLRALCENRGVNCIEIDLRWGITEEESQQGLSLAICLAEIERSNVFVGLLGERYGAIAKTIPEDFSQRHPWMVEAGVIARSYTEWEILYGALEATGRKDNSFFYFRDPAYLASVAEPERKYFCESDPALIGQLTTLKERIRREGFACQENYADPAAVADRIQHDLRQWIDQRFPAGVVRGQYQREDAAHEAFSNLVRRHFRGRSSILQALDHHEGGSGPPLVLVGEHGIGKSAVLAEWIATRGMRTPAGWRAWWSGSPSAPPPVLVHYVSASPEATDWTCLVKRLITQLSEMLDVPAEPRGDLGALTPELVNLLEMAARRSRLVVVMDGLDQLDDRESTLELDWLPEAMPANVRLVVSTSGGPTLAALRRRNWPLLDLGELSAEDRQEMVESYWGAFGKNPQTVKNVPLTQAEQTGNPLYLRTVIEELRILGDRKQLSQGAETLLRADTIEALYELVFDRWERDYNRGRDRLVEQSLSFLWGARFGLSEAELLDLLGTDDRRASAAPLPRLFWTPLAAVLRSLVIEHSGLMNFSHERIRQAVERRYVPTDKERTFVHAALAGYFGAREPTPRTVEELLWQLARAGQWEELVNRLADPTVLRIAWDTRPFEVRSLWVEAERRTGRRMAECYRPLFDVPEAVQSIAWPAIMLLNEAGHGSEAVALAERVMLLGEESGDAIQIRAGLSALAVIARTAGQSELALALLERRGRLCRRESDSRIWISNLIDRSAVHLDRGELQEAESCLMEAAQACRTEKRYQLLSAALGNLGLVAHARGDGRAALRQFREQEKIARRVHDLRALQQCLSNQAAVYLNRGDHRTARRLYERVEALCRQLGDRPSLLACLSNRALAAAAAADYDQAIALIKDKVRLCRELGDPSALADGLADQSWIIGVKLGMPALAMQSLNEAAEIAQPLHLPKLTAKIAAVAQSLKRDD